MPKPGKKTTSLYAQHLSKAIEEGYGKKIGSIDYDTPDGNMIAHLVKNVYSFSAAKNYTQLRQLTQALIGEDHKLRTYSQFKKAAFAINDTHVNQWLKAEYELAVSSSQMASKWQDIKDNGTKILEFDAIIDSHSSNICPPLNGVRKPVDDPFWNNWYPPNHYFCRSIVRQLADGAITPDHAINYPDKVDPLFQVNLAKQKLAFPPGHPYWIDCPTKILKEAQALITDPMFSQRLPGKNGGYVDIHGKADFNKRSEHIEAAQILADKGHQIKLMPEIYKDDVTDRKLFFPELKNNSNPDARFNGLLADFKVPDSLHINQRNISDAITKTAKKDVPICIISLINKPYKMQEILGGVRSALKQSSVNQSIKEVWIVFNDKTVMKIPRGIVSKNNFYKIAKAF